MPKKPKQPQVPKLDRIERRGGPRPVKRPDDARLQNVRAAASHEVKEENQRNVEAWAAVGMSKRQIAAKLDIHIHTLERYYGAEYERGRWRTELALKSKLIALGLRDGAPHAAIVSALKAHGAWADRVEVTGRDGGPIETRDLTPILEAMTDDERANALAVIDRLIAGLDEGQPSRTH